MTRAISIVITLALASLLPGAGRADAADGFDSEYAGESAFLTVGPGQTHTFQVFFTNTGTVTWTKGTSTEVSLAVCLPDKITCTVPSPNRTWNDGSWVSDAIYATQAQPQVLPSPPSSTPGGTGVLAPNQIATFIYLIKVPLNVTAGIYRFHGDLVQRSTGAKIHPVGYYQEATCACP